MYYQSSLKGKNIAKCSEKSIAAYIVLDKLYAIGKITRKPLLVLSQLTTEKSKEAPHAFVLLNKECNNPTKHVIYDIENPTLVVDEFGEKQYFAGLYSLTDEQYDSLLNGSYCEPTSLYKILGNYREVSDKRIYGRTRQSKSL